MILNIEFTMDIPIIILINYDIYEIVDLKQLII